jgi:hypothetical protein
MKGNERIKTALTEAGIKEQELASALDFPFNLLRDLLECDDENQWLLKFGIDPSELFVATARITGKDLYWLAYGK